MALTIKTSLICLLDKTDPPAHSFIDGMLAAVMASDPCFSVRLLVSSGTTGTRPYRYKCAVCMPMLPARNVLGRLLSIPRLLFFLPGLIHRDRKRGKRVVLFVRNEPVYLLAAALLSGLCDRVIFQSSFPHELFKHGQLKLKIARLLYKLSSRAVDGVLVVSPAGKDRVRLYFPPPCPVLVIPLLSDIKSTGQYPAGNSTDVDRVDSPVRFIYIGTHARQRELDTVLKAVVAAMQDGLNAHFTFVGGSQADIARLRRIEGVSGLEQRQRLQFVEKIPRPAALAMLAEADVGLSLIPPLELFRELSPTKLAEYMGSGLSVLASRGVPLQEEFVGRSDCGWLVDWDIEAIRRSMIEICADRDKIPDKKRKALEYAGRHLQYENYYPAFKQLLT